MVKTTTGPNQRVVVVGAGLAGLSAAMYLSGAGRDVTLVERESGPGGRAGRLDLDGHRFDNGPTVLTMPSLAERAFAAVDEDMSDWLTLDQLDPAYRTFFTDGLTLDIKTDPTEMTQNIAERLGPEAAAGFEEYVAFVTELYRLQLDDFIDRNMDSPLDLLSMNLVRLVLTGGFGRLESQAKKYLKEPHLRRAYTFQALYAGLAPQKALALYAVISYLDSVAGVFVPRGGMNALPTAMAGAAQKHGVDIRYDTEVTSIERSNGRATAIITDTGERIPCDATVLTADLPTAYDELLGQQPARVRRLNMSPSAVVLLAGSTADYSKIAHHNIHFGTAWKQTFTEIIDQGRVMSDPSFLVSKLSHSDPSLAPAGKHSYYVLFPAPNLDTGADINWDQFGPRYLEQMIQTMEDRGYEGFGANLTSADLTTPADWQRRGMAAGSPFAAAHSFGQTGPFRPNNLLGENIVFAGSGTVPGVGIPMVLISGRLAAERITG
ncbi:MAG: phytoene desaturase [Actinomycetia bacterium]|nr:phytoene desaturase [Actinomycetes bacterium]